MRFVDTNVLIYAVSPSPQEADKRCRAQELLEHGDLTLSVQVLQEFYHQVTRPNRTDPLTDGQALGVLGARCSWLRLKGYRATDGRGQAGGRGRKHWMTDAVFNLAYGPASTPLNEDP